MLLLCFSQKIAVNQVYSTKAEDEYVIKGNDVLMKCKIPSFVSDFVEVVGWIENYAGKDLQTLLRNSKMTKYDIFVS